METNRSRHLGNCGAFASRLEVPRRGGVVPSGIFYGNGSVLLGHRLFVFGGALGKHLHVSVFVCDLKSYKWSTLNPKSLYGRGSPQDQHLGTCFLHNEMLFAFVNEFNGRLKVYKLDSVLTDEWQRVKFKGSSYKKINATGAYHERREEAILCNGDDVHVFRVNGNQLQRQETKGTKPGTRVGHRCCMSPTVFFLAGDTKPKKLDLFALTLDTLTWSKVRVKSTNVPPERYRFSMSYVNGRIFVMGGYPVFNRLDVFEIKESRWKCVYPNEDSLPEDRLEIFGHLEGGTRVHSASITRDELLIVGGHGSKFLNLGVLSVKPRFV